MIWAAIFASSLSVLLAEILDVRELCLDRLPETLFSLIGRRNSRHDVDDEDLALFRR